MDKVVMVTVIEDGKCKRRVGWYDGSTVSSNNREIQSSSVRQEGDSRVCCLCYGVYLPHKLSE